MNFSNELYHHGILGMKWGVRRYQNEDGSYTTAGKARYNANYSKEQRARDKNVYSSGAVRRINKRMNKGVSISGARSKEADRINAYRKATGTVGNVGGIVSGVLGAIGGYYASNKVLAKIGTGDPSTDMAVKGLVSSGAFKISQILGQHGAESLTMLIGGYNPKKYRG